MNKTRRMNQSDKISNSYKNENFSFGWIMFTLLIKRNPRYLKCLQNYETNHPIYKELIDIARKICTDDTSSSRLTIDKIYKKLEDISERNPD